MNEPSKMSVRYVGKRPMDLCVITPLPEMADYAEDVAREIGISTCIAVSGVDNDVEVALEMIRREKVRLLATRGYTAYILQFKTTLPVLSIGYSSENFLETLLPYQNTGINVGHLCFPGQGLNFMKVANLLGLQGHRLEVLDRNQINEALATATRKHISLLIGGLGLVTRAAARGFKVIPLLAETREVVKQTFLDARAMLTIARANEGRHQFIKSILDTNPNIIIYVNENGHVVYANNRASEAFATAGAELSGRPLTTIFPREDFKKLFAALDREDRGVLTDNIQREFLFELTRLTPAGGPIGYILSLNSIPDMQRNERALRKSRFKRRAKLYTFRDIVGDSQAILATVNLARKYAASDDPVLITGETGTGKELFAQAIHSLSRRRAKPFIALNCASLPETLLESELFGYEEGAFTSARRGGKEGLLEAADGGTIFLDEVGEMPAAIQARLLRVLQDKVVGRLGGTRFVPLDVRVMSATNRSIGEILANGTFRGDFYYRINTLPLKISALRERKEDITAITASHLSPSHVKITRDAAQRLMNHWWPGNIRELLHVLDRAVVLSESNVIEARHIVFDEWPREKSIPAASDQERGENSLREALARNQYNRGKTAKALGISRSTLWKRLKRLGLG